MNDNEKRDKSTQTNVNQVDYLDADSDEISGGSSTEQDSTSFSEADWDQIWMAAVCTTVRENPAHREERLKRLLRGITSATMVSASADASASPMPPARHHRGVLGFGWKPTATTAFALMVFMVLGWRLFAPPQTVTAEEVLARVQRSVGQPIDRHYHVTIESSPWPSLVGYRADLYVRGDECGLLRYTFAQTSAVAGIHRDSAWYQLGDGPVTRKPADGPVARWLWERETNLPFLSLHRVLDRMSAYRIKRLPTPPDQPHTTVLEGTRDTPVALEPRYVRLTIHDDDHLEQVKFEFDKPSTLAGLVISVTFAETRERPLSWYLPGTPALEVTTATSE